MESAIRKILAQPAERKKYDEIPKDVRHQFNLPVKMGIYNIDFKEVRKEDISKKK